MTYKRDCAYAALLGIPCLIFDVIARMPPFFHMEGMHTAAQLILFPGWQLTHWLTSGLISRSIEYTLPMPLLIIGINVLVWGGVIWAAGSVVESSRRWQAVRLKGTRDTTESVILRSDVDDSGE
jgi:hypothetical protein